MANGAALQLRFVLVDEGPLLVKMTLVADLIKAGGPAELVSQETAMGVVAIAALQQPFVDPVTERPCELRPDIQVAPIAKVRGSFL